MESEEPIGVESLSQLARTQKPAEVVFLEVIEQAGEGRKLNLTGDGQCTTPVFDSHRGRFNFRRFGSARSRHSVLKWCSAEAQRLASTQLERNSYRLEVEGRGTKQTSEGAS
jgi:hypothetical protein